MQIVYQAPDGSRQVLNQAGFAIAGGALKEVICTECPESVLVKSNGRVVADDELVWDGADVEILFKLLGGGKGKKKKKPHTTAKHVAHKRKKVKLGVLKYYSISGDKIVRTRMHCAQKSCGQGVMMAVHHDRCHCGKCGLTLLKEK